MLPFALSANTAFGILLAVVMVSGYVVIWALWHFIFSKAPPDDPRERQEQADRDLPGPPEPPASTGAGRGRPSG